MSTLITMRECLFTKYIDGFGKILLRELKLEDDLEVIYQWLRYSKYDYCVYKDYTLRELYVSCKTIIDSPHRSLYVGIHDSSPIFIMEQFKVVNDPISNYIIVKDSDYGMRFMVSPIGLPIHGFTWFALSTIVDYLFSYIGINGIVTDFNAHDEKYRDLNAKAGFEYLKTVAMNNYEMVLTRCTRDKYLKAKKRVERKELKIKTSLIH